MRIVGLGVPCSAVLVLCVTTQKWGRFTLLYEHGRKKALKAVGADANFRGEYTLCSFAVSGGQAPHKYKSLLGSERGAIDGYRYLFTLHEGGIDP